jgi:outer membrane protein TolC
VIRIVATLMFVFSLPLSAAELPALRNHPGDWWTAFHHPGFTAVIEQGLDENPDPAAAAALLLAAQQNVRAAASERRPVAGIHAAYRWGRERSIMTGGVEDDIDPLTASARLSWELDVSRRVASSVRAAESRADIRRADVAAVRLALSIEIARTFIDLAFREEQVALLMDAAHNAKAVLDRAERRRNVGLDNPAAVEEERALYQQAEHSLMEAQIERAQQAANLRSLLGGSDPVAGAAPLDSFTLPAPPDLTRPHLHLSRPDVVRAHRALLAAQGDADAASRRRLPSLSLVVSAAGEGEDVGRSDTWEVWAGPTVSIPLWEPRRGAGAHAARADARAAEAAFVSVSLQAVREIDAAWTERERAAAMIAHMDNRYRALRIVEKSTARKRSAGLIQAEEHQKRKIARDAAAIARARWIAAGLQSHIALIGAVGGEVEDLSAPDDE